MASVDISKFKTSDWLKIGGALGFFIFGFLHWTTVSGPGGIGSASGNNVFDFFWTGTLPWLLVLATGVLTFLMVAGVMKKGGLPWPLIFLAATALATLLILIRLLFNPLGNEKDAIEAFGGSVGRGIGLWLSAISVIVAFVGAIMGFRESGGDFADLKDMNKLKASFQGAGASADAPPPPPPPPGMAPPPPPPPPA